MLCPKCNKALSDNCDTCQNCGEVVVRTEEAPATKKSKHKKKLFISVVAIVLVAAIALCVVLIPNDLTNDNAVICLSNGSYELIANLKKDETAEISSTKSAYPYGVAKFSEDGKFFYFFTKIDDLSQTGTLCRVEYDKLKPNSSRNEELVQIISPRVNINNWEVLVDNSVLYLNEDNALYYFTKANEDVKIAKDVSDFATDGKTIVYAKKEEVTWKRNGEDVFNCEYSLYSAALSNPSKESKIDSRISSIKHFVDVNTIIYTKQDDNREETYLVGAGKKPSLIGGRFEHLNTKKDKAGNVTELVFAIESETTVSLYDFVDDKYADKDFNLFEPTPEDFEGPLFTYTILTSASEDSYDAYFTSCTLEVSALKSVNGEGPCSIEEALTTDFGDQGKIVGALQSFINTYGSSADIKGYIEVTDEIKAELDKIAKLINEDYSWMDLSFGADKTGYGIDYEAYSLTKTAWENAQGRIALRKILQDESNDHVFSTIFVLKEGKLERKIENVLCYENYNGALLYNTTKLIVEKISIDEVSEDQLDKVVHINYNAQNPAYLYDSAKTITLSQPVADKLYSIYKDKGTPEFELHFNSTNVFMIDNELTLYAAKIEGTTTDSFAEICEDAEILHLSEKTLYYFADTYRGGFYGDLYKYTSSATCIATDIATDFIFIYGDGTTYIATDYDEEKATYELAHVDADGIVTPISENVSLLVRVDEKQTLIIADGNLYNLCDDNFSFVAENVTNVWVKDYLTTINNL